ncbi:MAG: hypothetical protein Q8M98_00380, partial [Candidatus Cloacimonadaceae bacterium]|nr:hypothetical protein [Candidatus Cloacimonadaceae bacterium]
MIKFMLSTDRGANWITRNVCHVVNCLTQPSLFFSPGEILIAYTDMNVAGGLHTYYVTALYGTNESLPSNVISVFVMPAMHTELFHDD